MKYNQLGTSTLTVSEISFGCMSLPNDESESISLLHQALGGGITLFDTADLYEKGKNEETVGKAFKGKRDQVVLATKVGNQWRPDGSGWDWNPTKAYILESVEKSLRSLQTDYIDLYQLHGGTIEDPIDETIEAFELLKEQGKIREYGMSSIRPNVIRQYVKKSNLVSVMMQYSLLDRRPEEQMLDLLHDHKIGVLARGSLAQGLLLGKTPKTYLNHTLEEVTQTAEALKAIAGAENVLNTSVKYVLHHPAVTTAVLGIRTASHLEQAFAVVKAPSLSEETLLYLHKQIPAEVYEHHRN
ncbi:aldo/keto reductase [Rufibacter tibetensis]|uniref:Oxidoreductase n=1 Tax=Rufibacter tibetensis TaxID=512763 RepID=A0A0P0CSR0_9BACT|nr:aldo/keto reductase [Rufibacter tibetensis]ALJ00519.1 oxidoreductase [Rufibacter tibetensis]